MDYDEKSVIWQSGVEGLVSDEFADYVSHVYVHQGSLDFNFLGNPLHMEAGNCMILVTRNMVSDLCPSTDFEAEVIYVTNTFLETCAPRNNFAIRGTLMLYVNPVWVLTAEEQQRCVHNFEEVRIRLMEEHPYKSDVMSSACLLLFLDFYKFQMRIYPGEGVSFLNADLMIRFLQMLTRGDYRQNREVTYYADALCVTPKHLSEVSKKVSGFGANYWINRFTIIELQRLLRRRDISLIQIADDFNFTSQAYFSRYVQNYLGVSPTAYRE